MMHRVFFILCLCICLNACKNSPKPNEQTTTSAIPTIQNPTETQFDSVSATPTHDYALEEALRKALQKSLDSAWAVHIKSIPETDFKATFVEPFYKHFTGTFDNQPAELNLTFSRAAYDGEGTLVGTLIVGVDRQLIPFFGQTEASESTGSRISLWLSSQYELDSLHLPFSIFRGAFANDITQFNGLSINQNTFKPTSFTFTESYDNGAIPLQLATFGKSEKIKTVNTRYLLSRFKGTQADGTNYYLLDIKGKVAKSSTTDYDKNCESFKNNFLKDLTKQVSEAMQNPEDGHFETGVGNNFSAAILSNHSKLLVIQYNDWFTDGMSYGGYSTACEMYDLEKNIRLKESEILKPDYKEIVTQSAQKHYSWMVEDEENNYVEKLKFAAVTSEGLLMLGTGNHGWYYSYFFFPMAEIKACLKPSFVKTYLRNVK